MSNIEPILGRYLHADVDGLTYRIFFEEAGRGIPLLCLHTAGADSRQYRHLMNDRWVTERYRVIAFDMPYHGRSNPPDEWWLRKYLLEADTYLALIRSVWQALDLRRPVALGCSMGGAVVLKLAVDYQRELRGIIGLESSAYAPGRYNDYPPSGHSWWRARRELHLRAVRPAESRGEQAGELVVLQPVRTGRLRR